MQLSEYRAQDLRQSTPQSQSDLIPFVQLNGEWTIPDDVLANLFFRIEADGLVEGVFFDGSIHDWRTFIQAVKSPQNICIFFFHENIPMAFAWLNGLARHTAFAHFCVLRHAWGAHADEMGKMALNYWMSWDGEAKIQTIMGTIPTQNRRALAYVRRIGFERCGTIPGLLKDRHGKFRSADIVYFSRDH